MELRKRILPQRKRLRKQKQRDIDLVRCTPFTIRHTLNLLPTGPSCQKMVDLSAERTFVAAAFEPTEEELDHHEYLKREKQRAKRRSVLPNSRKKSPSPSPTDPLDRIIELDDSDDDLPDVDDIFNTPVKKEKGKGKARAVMSSSDDVSRCVVWL
jgi:hypothetical protein